MESLAADPEKLTLIGALILGVTAFARRWVFPGDEVREERARHVAEITQLRADHEREITEAWVEVRKWQSTAFDLAQRLNRTTAQQGDLVQITKKVIGD